MATKYCVNCDRVVEAKRQIGVGTFLLVIITSGLWLLVIPFYSKRCPMCKGTSFGTRPKMNKEESTASTQTQQNIISKQDPMEQIKKLQELKDAGAITNDEFIEKKKKILDTI